MDLPFLTRPLIATVLIMSSVIDPVQRQLDAFNAHDLEAFLDCYAPDAVIRLGWTTTMTGRDEIRAYYAPAIGLPQLRAEVLNRLASGEWVVDDEQATWTGGAARGLAVYQVRDNLIVSSLLLAEEPA